MATRIGLESHWRSEIENLPFFWKDFSHWVVLLYSGTHIWTHGKKSSCIFTYIYSMTI